MEEGTLPPSLSEQVSAGQEEAARESAEELERSAGGLVEGRVWGLA